MTKQSATPHHEILEAALQGLEAQKHKLEDQIAQVRSMLGGRATKQAKAPAWANGSASGGGSPKKRVLSPEARQRIAAAQKKRWAAYRKNRG
jgi:hypothetical protein